MRCFIALVALVLPACNFDPSAQNIQVGDVGFGATRDASLDGPTGIQDASIDAIVRPTPDPLNNDSLLARYMINEASSGSIVTSIQDFADNPLLMNIVYDGGAEFVGSQGTRAINFPDRFSGHRIRVRTEDTKIESELDQNTRFTIEMVVDIDEVRSNSRLMHLGRPLAGGILRFGWNSDDTIALFWHDNQLLAEWEPQIVGGGRTVLTVSVDMSDSDADERIKLFQNGSVVTPRDLDAPERFSVLSFSDQPEVSLVFGNRGNGDRGIDGRIHYAALYSANLSNNAILENATRLC